MTYIFEAFSLVCGVCIDTVVTQHFKVFFGDVYDKSFYEVYCRDTFLYGLIIFMPGVVKCDIITVIFIDTGCCNNRPSEMATDVYDGNDRSVEIRFCPDIEFFGMIFVNIIFDFAGGRIDGISHFFKKDFTKSVTKKAVVKMLNRYPNCKVAGTAFGDESINVRIPFEIATESMKDTDKTGSEVFGVIHVIKHAKDNIPDRGK